VKSHGLSFQILKTYFSTFFHLKIQKKKKKSKNRDKPIYNSKILFIGKKT